MSITTPHPGTPDQGAPVVRRGPLAGTLALLSLVTWSGCNAIMGYEEGESAAGTEGATPSTEDCLNRVDDDGNRFADCEDPACSPDHRCVEPAPVDWIGVGWLYEGGSPASCPFGQWIELFETAALVPPPATCSCACEPPDTTCAATVSCSNEDCGGAALDSAIATADCSPLILSVAPQDCLATDLRTIAEACVTAGTLTSEPIQWIASAAACVHAEGGHCPDGQACVPSRATADRGPCVLRAGEHSCPPSYPEQLIYWEGAVDDGRSCTTSTCFCGAPTVGTCECTGYPCGARGYYDAQCTNETGLAMMDGSTCAHYGAMSPPNPPFTFGVMLEGAEVTDPGSCEPSGISVRQGEISPAGAITVCCVAR